MDKPLGSERLVLKATSAGELQGQRKSGGHSIPSLEFVCQWGQLHSPRASEKLICTFSYRGGRERLILPSFPSTAKLLTQTVHPITAPPGDFAVFLNLFPDLASNIFISFITL